MVDDRIVTPGNGWDDALFLRALARNTAESRVLAGSLCAFLTDASLLGAVTAAELGSWGVPQRKAMAAAVKRLSPPPDLALELLRLDEEAGNGAGSDVLVSALLACVLGTKGVSPAASRLFKKIGRPIPESVETLRARVSPWPVLATRRTAGPGDPPTDRETAAALRALSDASGKPPAARRECLLGALGLLSVRRGVAARELERKIDSLLPELLAPSRRGPAGSSTPSTFAAAVAHGCGSLDESSPLRAWADVVTVARAADMLDNPEYVRAARDVFVRGIVARGTARAAVDEWNAGGVRASLENARRSGGVSGDVGRLVVVTAPFDPDQAFAFAAADVGLTADQVVECVVKADLRGRWIRTLSGPTRLAVLGLAGSDDESERLKAAGLAGVFFVGSEYDAIVRRLLGDSSPLVAAAAIRSLGLMVAAGRAHPVWTPSVKSLLAGSDDPGVWKEGATFLTERLG